MRDKEKKNYFFLKKIFNTVKSIKENKTNKNSNEISLEKENSLKSTILDK